MNTSLTGHEPGQAEMERLATGRSLENHTELLALLDAWVVRGWLRALDRAFVGLLIELQPQGDPLVAMGAALASHQLGHGHVCLDLGAILEDPDFALSLPPEGDAGRGVVPLPSRVLSGLDVGSWRAALEASPLVAVDSGAQDASATPLVLAGNRLYLRRYWRYEQSIGLALEQRLQVRAELPADLAQRLGQLFDTSLSGTAGSATDWQKLACAIAVRSGFSIITGGPGTGKTTTIVRLLALLQTLAVEGGRPLRIALAAPTGKAAARLSASIGVQVGSLDVPPAVRAAIPADVTTLHRLLGRRPDSRHFRHDAHNPLPLDLLVVDEASMIDLEMMACVLDALPHGARMVLVGDKDQLASVEAGSVLGDLCRDADAGRYSPDTRAWLERIGAAALDEPGLLPGDAARHALAQQTVMLRHSRRFGQDSGIGRLARQVNAGEAAAARQVFAERADVADRDLFAVSVRESGAAGLDRLLLEGHDAASRNGPRGYAHYLEVLRAGRPPHATPTGDPAWSEWAQTVLKAFDEFRLLCAVRKGDQGIEAINRRVAGALHQRGLIAHRDGWFEGRPVLITRNDYSLGLMNGDIGIALAMPEERGDPMPGSVPGALRVAFERNDGSGLLRFILPSRLSDVETVFAMTVHKSQGSEFAHTALILPDTINPVLTRELVYTAVTRAKTWFTLVETADGVFEEAVGRRVRRVSGLAT